MRTGPLDIWGRQSATITLLLVIVAVLAVAVAMLGAVEGWRLYAGPPAYLVPPTGPGLVRPGIIADALGTDYAARVFNARFTFTPATVKARHKEMEAALHPTLLSTFRAQADREEKMVREYQMSSQIGPVTAQVMQRRGEQVMVGLDATRTVFVGGQQMRDEAVHAEMTLMIWLAQGHPDGLKVVEFKSTPALTPTGK